MSVKVTEVSFDAKFGYYRARFRDGEFDTRRKVPVAEFIRENVDYRSPSMRGQLVATIWADREAARINESRKPDSQPVVKLRLPQLLRWFIEKNPNAAKPATIAKYQDCEKRINSLFSPETLPERIDEDAAVEYRNALQQRGVRNRTIKGDLVFLKQVIVYAHQHGEKTGVDRVRLWKLPRIPKQRALLQALSIEELRKVLSVVESACPRDGERIRRIIVFAVTTGCRRSPLLNYEAAWCDRERLSQRIPGTAMKGGEDRWSEGDFEVPVCAWAAEVSAPHRPGERYSWPNPRTCKPNNQLDRSLWAIADNAGIRRFSLHELRKTFSSILADHGVHEQVIAVLMGHAASSVTREYIQKQPKTLRDAVAWFDTLRPYLEGKTHLAMVKTA